MSSSPEDPAAEPEPRQLDPPGRPPAAALDVALEAAPRASIRWAILALSVAVVAAFFTVTFLRARNGGVCCADDSAYAVVAKNLARGDGYSGSVRLSAAGQAGFQKYDPLMGSGPTLIVPAAAVIRVLGNRPWVPGVALLVIVTTILAGVSAGLRGEGRPDQLAAFLALLLAGSYFLMVYHFEHWYALLGEVPAALLVIAGIVWITRPKGTALACCAAGGLFGLAIMAKVLAALAVAPALIFVIVRTFRPGTRKMVLFFALGVAAPAVLFEAVKFVDLGPRAYLDNVRTFTSYLSTQGVTKSGPDQALTTRLMATAGANDKVFQGRFGVSAWTVFALFPWILGVAKLADLPRRCFLAVVLLLTSSGLLLAWWLALSVGWARYALIALICLAAANGLLAFAPGRRGLAAVACAAMTLLVIQPPRDRFLYPLRPLIDAASSESTRSANLVATAAQLAAMRSREPDAVFVGGGWATVMDLEYVLDRPGQFVRYDVTSLETIEQRPVYLVRNRVWVRKDKDALYQAWEERCPVMVVDLAPYLVSRCE